MTDTWLTPFHDEWVKRIGAIPPNMGEMAKVFKPLKDDADAPAVWAFYLANEETKYAGTTRFAQRYKFWKDRR